MLKDQLLYTEEMQQYDNVITKKSHRMTTANCINSDEVADSVNSDDVIMPSSVYGAYHLLRLFGIVQFEMQPIRFTVYILCTTYM